MLFVSVARPRLLSRPGVPGFQTGTTGVYQPGQISVSVVVIVVRAAIGARGQALSKKWESIHQDPIDFLVVDSSVGERGIIHLLHRSGIHLPGEVTASPSCTFIYRSAVQVYIKPAAVLVLSPSYGSPLPPKSASSRRQPSSSRRPQARHRARGWQLRRHREDAEVQPGDEVGRASCRERVLFAV